MLKALFVFIFITFLSCSPAKVSYRESLSLPLKPKLISYAVRKGDSLWKISQKYGVSVEEIMKTNKISSAQGLKVGQKIYLMPQRQRKEGNRAFIWPIKGEVLSFFGETVNSSVNEGLNIKASSNEQEVKAAAKGEVVFASQLKGWGQTVILKHEQNLYTVYANLDNLLVKEGDMAKPGQPLAKVCFGGNGSHILHFEVRKKHLPQNPLDYLN